MKRAASHSLSPAKTAKVSQEGATSEATGSFFSRFRALALAQQEQDASHRTYVSRVWSKQRHSLLPLNCRALVEAVVLAHRKGRGELSGLPKDILWLLLHQLSFERYACEDVSDLFPLPSPRAPHMLYMKQSQCTRLKLQELLGEVRKVKSHQRRKAYAWGTRETVETTELVLETEERYLVRLRYNGDWYDHKHIVSQAFLLQPSWSMLGLYNASFEVLDNFYWGDSQ